MINFESINHIVHTSGKRLKILFIELEFSTWKQASKWSYTSQMAIEEGFDANDVEYSTITTPWLKRSREIFRGQKFDQVWVEIVHQDFNNDFFEWLQTMAPIRVGLVAESLEYSPEECAVTETFTKRKGKIEKYCCYLTHVIACDERDAQHINENKLAKAIWWPQAIPSRYICRKNQIQPSKPALFGGSVYGNRREWINHQDLKNVLFCQNPSDGRLFPFIFNFIHFYARVSAKLGFPPPSWMLPVYLLVLRYVRRECFSNWIRAMQEGYAVVNLPHFLKAYPGRILEAMAAGRPVISWHIPQRPRTGSLFQENVEILFFDSDNPKDLIRQIHRVHNDSDLAFSLVNNARNKILRLHTMEKRIKDVLHWIETGEEPVYD